MSFQSAVGVIHMLLTLSSSFPWMYRCEDRCRSRALGLCTACWQRHLLGPLNRPAVIARGWL